MRAPLLGSTPGVDISDAVGAFVKARRDAERDHDKINHVVTSSTWSDVNHMMAVHGLSYGIFQERVAIAVEALTVAVSGDPLARWITEHAFPAHFEEAISVLDILPCTVAELQEFASEEGWCEAWWQLWFAASGEGLVPVSKIQKLIDALDERGITAVWECTGGGTWALFIPAPDRDGISYHLCVGDSGGEMESHHRWDDVGRQGWFVQREQVDRGDRYEIIAGHIGLHEIDALVAIITTEVNA